MTEFFAVLYLIGWAAALLACIGILMVAAVLAMVWLARLGGR